MIFLTGSMISSQATAQYSNTARLIAEDGWIEKMNRSIGIKISLDNVYETFRVSTPTNDVVLYPNITSISTLGVYYRFLRLSFGVAPDFLPGNGDEATKGQTKSFYLGISAFLKHWYQNFTYSAVNGFYLENTADYISWSPGDPYIQFPDLYFTGISGTTGYNLNPKLSLKSLAIQTERQLKSVGSFTGLLNYRYYLIDDRSMPSPGGATQKSNNLEISLGPGYIYNYVHNENFYASLAAIPSAGLIITRLTTRYASGDIESTQHNWAFRWDARGALGYNGRQYFAGFYVTATGMEFKQENTTAMNYNTRVYYQIFFGFRFNAPKPVNRFFDSINQKF
jgi:hypothetical protein